MYCLEGSLLWQKKGIVFLKKQPVIAERQTFFKNAEAQSSFCSALTLSLSEHELSMSMGWAWAEHEHGPSMSWSWAERLHFTLVGLFAGFTIAASCARAAPGSPEEKQAFSKGNCQIQTPSLSQRSQSLKPLFKNSFSTIFQGPGPGEAPFHFSRFVCWVHYCSKLCQSSSWKPRREASLFQRQLPNSNSKPFPKEPIP